MAKRARFSESEASSNEANETKLPVSKNFTKTDTLDTVKHSNLINTNNNVNHDNNVDHNEEEDDDDEDDDDDSNTHSNNQNNNTSKNKNSKKQKLSSHDIQVARETAELFKSNIFKLEIDELIKELKLKDSHCILIEKVLHKLHNIIQQIPDSDALSFDDAIDFFKNSNVTIPFPDPKPNSLNYNLQYTTPDDISLVGSFGLKTGIQQKNGMSIDVCLTMQKNLIEKKDYLNYRILYKQAFYLAYLTHHLSILAPKNNLPIDLKFDYHNGDNLCPSLIISSNPNTSNNNNNKNNNNNNDLIFNKTNFKIRILIGLPFGCFDSKKILPDKNCIRIQNSLINSVDDLPPTPLYNASILQSTTYSYYLKYLYTNKKATESFKDAAALGKLWLSQRGFSSNLNEGGFGHFEFNILMSALLQGGGLQGNKILLHGYSSYQLFKGTIKYLATQDLCDDGYLSFNSLIDENNSNSYYKKNGFNVPTIFDKNTKINLLWKMSKSSYSILKKFAIETLDLLNDLVKDRFNQIFLINNNNLLLKYDSVVSIPWSKLIELTEDNFNPLEKISFINLENYLLNKIYKILIEALDDRIYQIDIKLSKNTSNWSINKRKFSNPIDQYLIIGLFLNPNESDKRITKGPLHLEKDLSDKFISFWGKDKSQLRRFKDNTIQWSCLWDISPTDSVVLTIVKYILDKHLSNSSNKSHLLSNYIIVNSSKFTSLLPKPLVPHTTSSQPLILPQHFISLKNSYDLLSKELINLINLPLKIRNILPISSSLRNTSIILPVPFATGNPDFFNESIIQFETSNKWPEELITLEDTKTAFLLKICNELINKNLSIIKDCFILNDDLSIPYNKSIKILRIITNDGYGFQFRILTENDEILYLNAIENASKLNNGPSQVSSIELSYIRFMQKYIKSIKHHRSISILVTHFPYYSATVRLFKLWLDCQLILTHIPEEVIELIVLQAFVDPLPYGIPNSVMSGFLRVLKFLSNWNWKDDPLILDLSREFNSKFDSNNDNNYIDKITDKLDLTTYQIINKSFKKLRERDPQGLKVPYFIGTKDDISGKIWTQGISIVIASRLTSLSRIVLDVLSKCENEINDKFLKLIFTPALKDYNIIIKIDNNKNDLKILRKQSGILPNNIKFKNLVEPLFKFNNLNENDDPILSYYRELISRYGEVIVWSTRKFGGLIDNDQRVITGLIIPGNESRKFRVNIGYPFKPIKNEDNKVAIDIDDILKNAALIGGELIKSVDIKQK